MKLKENQYITELEINGRDVDDAEDIVYFDPPETDTPYWFFKSKTGNEFYATGAVHFALRTVEEEKKEDGS